MKPVRYSAAVTAFAAAGVLFLAACTTPETGSHHGPMTEGTLAANTRTIGSGYRPGPTSEMPGVPEGIVRHRGQNYFLKNRGTTLLRPGTVTEGLTLERNGDVTLADGRRLRLQEGWMVTRGGELREAPPWLD